MRELWKSRAYAPEAVSARYIKAMIDGGYRLYEVESHHLTIRECAIDRRDMAASLADECDARRGLHFGSVRVDDSAAIHGLAHIAGEVAA